MTCQRHTGSGGAPHFAGAAAAAPASAGRPSVADAFGLDATPVVEESFVECAAAPAFHGPAVTAFEAGVHTIILSEEAYQLVEILRREDENDDRVVERALAGLDAYRIVEKALKSRELRKAFNCTRQMRKRGFGDETTTAMCRALFGAQSEKDLRSAFRLLDLDESGFIDKDELWAALPIMSEDVPQERLDELFRLVDADGSGLIDFEEFATLVRSFNPKLQDNEGNVFSQFQDEAQGGLDIVGEVIGSAASGATSTLSALSTAWSADLPGLSPMEMRKAGAVLKKMREAGYKNDMAQSICRALFCEQSEKSLQRAFRFYDKDRSGFLDAVEFREALPLMGENVPDEQIDDLFKKVAIDESGCINFAGFCKLVKAMNPKEKKKKKRASQDSDPLALLRDAAGRVSRTWAAKTRDLQDEEEPEERPPPQRHRKKTGGSDGSAAAGAGAAASGESRHSAGRVITLPPRSQRVSVQRYDQPSF